MCLDIYSVMRETHLTMKLDFGARSCVAKLVLYSTQWLTSGCSRVHQVEWLPSLYSQLPILGSRTFYLREAGNSTQSVVACKEDFTSGWKPAETPELSSRH